ncbi:DHS-like NAD/FAD-binding domain-containing protein [Lasiosphaeria miniovina]|uniref:DHS-like NAD/FAD-binding domain-containing protein n=1 Tax=Lasiosphaeria miniovina TaxID=1954250 RepID=A0AA39ZU72_9PEZI|nr:DHS-like NAD/FAD-binding domain-containing protein [Lasiosphaeria miniovina]KAK0703772.1 DHS-like NAD/FAD-binding domain-containing protein [Lasiosphaeria miniovina]
MKASDLSDATATTEEIQVRTDGPPPPKRRRLAAPRPRTTAYVDLEARNPQDDENLDTLLAALRKKKRIVVIAGAGISVSAGIPDFRSSTGLFSTLRSQHKLKASGKHLFDASVYKHNASTESFHTMVRELAHLTSQAEPTPFHHMLASIAEEGRLMRLYSQNIDSIDTQMPPLATNVPLNTKGPWPTTVQLHGGLEKMVCTKCGHLEAFNASLFEGPEPPLCEKCREQDQVRTAFAGKRSHGIGRLRPRIVLYNEYNPDEEAIGNVSKADLRRVPDAVIVVGTSLKIPGVRRIVKEMCQLTRSRRDGITAWLNLDPEPQGVEFKDCWDLVVRGKCDDIAELVNLPRWDQQDIGDRDSYMVTGDELKEKRLADSLNRARVDVLLERKRKRDTPEDLEPARPPAVERTPTSTLFRLAEQVEGGMPTPSASPRIRSPLPVGKVSGNVSSKGKTKQSTLAFGSLDAPKTKSSSSVPIKGKTAVQRKPRQPKKDQPKPPKDKLNRLDRAFKATKSTATKPPKALNEKLVLGLKPCGLPSPLELSTDLPSLSALPALRPPTKTQAFISQTEESAATSSELSLYISSSPPATPVLGPKMTETISPTSKPQSLSHLID